MYTAAEKGTLRRGRDVLALNTPPGPVVVAKVRGRVLHALARHVGSVSTQATLRDIAHDLRVVLKKKDTTDAFCDHSGLVPASTLLDGLYLSMLSNFPPGAVISEESTVAASWRIAGNLPALAAGATVGAWEVQEYPEWCLVLISGADKGSLQLQVHSGRSSGLTIALKCVQARAEKAAVTCGIVADRDLDVEAVNPRQLVGAWLHAHMSAGVSFTVTEIKCPQSLKARNKKLHLARQRPERVCPRNFPWECYACPMTVAKCSLAVHTSELLVKDCTWGHQGFVVRGHSVCVVCEANEWRHMRGMVPLYLPPLIKEKQKE